MEEITFFSQMTGFLLAVGMGAALCLVYDLFRIVRIAAPPGRIGAFAQDVLWFAIAAVVTYLLCLARCKGEVRSFIIVGEAVGFILTRLTVSRLIIAAARRIIKVTRRAFHAVTSAVKKAFSRFAMPVISKISGKIKKIIYQIAKKPKKALRRRMPLLYNRKKVKAFINSDAEQ